MAAITQLFTGPGTFPILIDQDNILTGKCDMFMMVDSTLGVVNLHLPLISTLGAASGIRISVFDQAGMAATHAINVIPSGADQINATDVVALTKTKGQLQIEIADSFDVSGQWTAQLVSATVPTKGLTTYAYFWQSVTDVAGTIAANNGKCLFQTPSSNNTTGITTTPASGDIIMGVGSAGIYKISTFVAGAEPNAFAVFIGAVKVAGTVYGSGAGTQQNGGFSLVTLADGDVVSLRTDNCAAAVTLQLAGTTDTAQVVCSILFEKMN